MQGESTWAGAWQEGGGSDDGTETVGETQKGRERIVDRLTRLVGQPGQVVVPAESRADVSAHSFWKRGTTAMFDIQFFNLGVGSYLYMTPEKAIAKVKKEKKDLYLQACLDPRSTFTAMVYSADGIIEEVESY